MFILTTWALRVFGLIGILAAILFTTADLLYNHVPGSKSSPALKMSGMPASRLLLAGTLGLIGSWLYTLATLHVYLAFRPAGEIYAFALAASFAAVMIAYGVAHAAYFSIATAARVAAQAGQDVEAGAKLGNVFFQRLTTITYIPVAIFSLMMLYGILAGHSLYPRWMVIFLPVVLYLVKTPVLRLLKGYSREVVNDCYDNLILFIFYVISSIVLWNAAVL
jgi:hypothetical protein